jgi:predicted transcriptional regulator
MKEKKVDKKLLTRTFEKMLKDKELVVSYMKGKTTIQALTKKGIKFAKPL